MVSFKDLPTPEGLVCVGLVSRPHPSGPPTTRLLPQNIQMVKTQALQTQATELHPTE